MLEIRKGADVGRHEGGGAGLWRREGDQRGELYLGLVFLGGVTVPRF